MSKIVSIIMSCLFVYFAFLQFNDPDPEVWVTLYILMALLPLATYFKENTRKVYTIFLFVMVMWFCTYLDNIYYWGKEGFPSVMGSMGTGGDSSELIREAGGTLICILVILRYRNLQ